MEVEARKVVGSAEQKGLPTGTTFLEDFLVVRVVIGVDAVDGGWLEELEVGEVGVGVGFEEFEGLAPTESTFSLCSVLPTDGEGATVEAGGEVTEGEGGKGGSRAVTGD